MMKQMCVTQNTHGKNWNIVFGINFRVNEKARDERNERN